MSNEPKHVVEWHPAEGGRPERLRVTTKHYAQNVYFTSSEYPSQKRTASDVVEATKQTIAILLQRESDLDTVFAAVNVRRTDWRENW